jgi:integrase
MAVLRQWKQQHPEGRLFAVKKLDTAWENLIERAGIEDFRFHDCRHDFASRLVMAGVDLNTVRELLGHGDIKMTLRYAHLAPEHKAAAVAVLVRKK